MKYQIKFIFTALILVIVSACSSDDGRTDNTGTANYFPLAESNSWSYDYENFEGNSSTAKASGVFTIELGAPVNESGRDYFTISTDGLGAFAFYNVSQSGRSSYVSQSIDLSQLNVNSNEVIQIENLKILDEGASNGSIFYRADTTQDITDFLGDDSPATTLGIYLESKMVGPQSSIDLSNEESYNDILHTKSSIFIDAFTTIEQQSFDYNLDIFSFNIVVLEQDIKIIDKTEIQTNDMYFARDIGLVKSERNTRPSNIEINTVYTLDSTINGNASKIIIDFENETIVATNVVILVSGFPVTVPSVSINFSDISVPFLNDLADGLVYAQEEIDNLPNRKTVNELSGFLIN